MAVPKKIKLIHDKDCLIINWDDGKTHEYPLKFLRDESPDATNKGETILWKKVPPQPKGPDLPGKYEIDNIETVGNYAISIKWKDGYDYGIYSWDLLYKLGDYLIVKDTSHSDFGHTH